MYAIKRAINGISINGDEWLLNDDGSTTTFATYGEAEALLALNNIKADIVPCLPDGITKEIKSYPTIWGYTQYDSGRIGCIDIMVPIPGDHPCLVTLKRLDTASPAVAWTVDSEGYD